MECITFTIESNEKVSLKEKSKYIIDKLNNTSIDMKNPDNFNVLINYRIKKFIKLIVDGMYPETKACKNAYKIKFIYLHYDFMNSNIEKLISNNEGLCCCADKSYHIIVSYLHYLLDGEIPKTENTMEFESSNSINYMDWFDFCEGLYQLYYGNPQNYLNAYKKLLEDKY